MTLIFDPGWLNWDIDADEIAKTFRKKAAGPISPGAQNKLNGLLQIRKKRREGKIFLTFFNQLNVQAALFRATTRYNSSPDAKQLLTDVLEPSKTITIKQGTHQPENPSVGDGYTLHFDAHSSRNGKCFHLYVGQLPSGAVTITSIAFKPGATFVVATPDNLE
jgi:hypothetical protein